MMAKTAAQRKAEQRKKLKEAGTYSEFRKVETERQKSNRKKRKLNITTEEKNIQRAKKRKEMKKYREKKRCAQSLIAEPLPDIITPIKAFRTKSSYGKAMAKAKRALPSSPSKKKAVVKRLFQQFSPGSSLGPNLKKCSTTAISDETYNAVKEFYVSDTVSYQAPGTKDFKIIRDFGTKQKIQKRYLFLTLGETYQQFKEANPTTLIGRSKFCDLRPQNVCLRHETPANLCLCIYHENIMLLLNACSFLPNSITEFIRLVVCNKDLEDCMLQTCEDCKNLVKFRNLIAVCCPSNDDEEVTYRQWAKDESGKLSREKLSGSVEEVVEKLENKLPKFWEHEFVREKQANNFKSLKSNVEEGTIIIQIDFSENYTFSYQDEIQSVYWATQSCTLFTAMAYINYQGTPVSIPIVVVSDYMQQDKYAAAVFNDTIIEKLKKDFPLLNVKSVIYQSDGTGKHFKQKYSLCLGTIIYNQFQWHFSATSHGKGAIDGLGGTVKRRIREATLSRTIDPQTAKEFAAFATKICPKITILYVSEQTINTRKSYLENLWAPNGLEIKAIPETRRMHFFEKVSPYEIKFSIVSVHPKQYRTFDFNSGKTDNLTESDEEFFADDVMPDNITFSVGEWVLVSFCGKRQIKYFVGQIVATCGLSVITVKFLRFDKDSKKFSWPETDDISDIDFTDISAEKISEPSFDHRMHYTFSNVNFENILMG